MYGATAEDAQRALMARLPRPVGGLIESWWVAEDERHDGSDNESAVFVPAGITQHEAERRLRLAPELVEDPYV